MSAKTPKKRKAQAPLDEDGSLYQAFSTAASTISQLYTQAVQQQRRHYAAGSRDFADKLLTWAREREAAGEYAISTAQLIGALEREVQTLATEEEAAGAAPAVSATPRQAARAAAQHQTLAPQVHGVHWGQSHGQAIGGTDTPPPAVVGALCNLGLGGSAAVAPSVGGAAAGAALLSADALARARREGR